MNFSVPATSANLGPGFDCLGLSLDFRNYFSIVESNTQSVVVTGEGANNSNLLYNNTFVKVFNNVYKSLNGNASFSFNFQNNIPISRGLGSSSAIIVGAVFSAYKMAGIIPDKEEVLNIALHYEKHPDNITPATFGGFNASFVKREKGKNSVVNMRSSMPKSVKGVVVIPNRPMSTKKSRSVLPKVYSVKDCVFNLSRSSVLALAFSHERWDLLRDSTEDSMHQNKRMESYPLLFKVQQVALSNGALMSTLSGSGSTIFNLCYCDDAKSLARRLSEKVPRFKVLSLALDNDGVKLER